MRDRRIAGRFHLLRLVALACAFIGLLALTLGYRQRIVDLQGYLYQRCVQRQAYDEASNDARLAMIDLYQRQAALEAANRSADGRLRRERIAAYDTAIAELQAAVDAQVPGSCHPLHAAPATGRSTR